MKHSHIDIYVFIFIILSCFYLICGDIKLWYVWGKKHIVCKREGRMNESIKERTFLLTSWGWSQLISACDKPTCKHTRDRQLTKPHTMWHTQSKSSCCIRLCLHAVTNTHMHINCLTRHTNSSVHVLIYYVNLCSPRPPCFCGWLMEKSSCLRCGLSSL